MSAVQGFFLTSFLPGQSEHSAAFPPVPCDPALRPLLKRPLRAILHGVLIAVIIEKFITRTTSFL